ncbi:MAG: IclR family transcriptional regulator, partial [Microcella pacifica]
MTEANYSIRSVQRVCDILDLVQSQPEGLSLVAFATATDLPKSSVFRYLATLESRGYVERTEDGGYRLGMALSGDRIDILARRLRPQLIQLRDELGETINLGMLDGSRVAYLDVIESKSSIRNAPRASAREYIHCTALGKVLASTRPDDDVTAILKAEGMPAVTRNTITDVSTYLEDLAVTRARGYALD